MVTALEAGLAFATVVFGVTGLVMYFVVLSKYRTESHPRWPMMNPKHWVGLRKQKAWFSPKGFRLYIWSLVFLWTASSSAIIRSWVL